MKKYNNLVIVIYLCIISTLHYKSDSSERQEIPELPYYVKARHSWYQAAVPWEKQSNLADRAGLFKLNAHKALETVWQLFQSIIFCQKSFNFDYFE